VQVVVERKQRLDAQRNRQAVIDAALDLLAQRPNASMQEIAEASSVGRTTVYRHFPRREDLLRALFEHVVVEAQTSLTDVASQDAPAEQILRDLGGELVEFGMRFRFLHAHRAFGEQAFADSMEVPEDPVRQFLDAALERGELRSDLTLHWTQSIVQSLAIAAMDELISGRVDADQAASMLGETLVAALVAD
jgi:AcrR family transcriptional regulator